MNGGSQQRRKLVKKSSHHYSRSSSGLDSAHDTHSIHSKRSSTNSIRRTPSAPPPVRPPNTSIQGAFANSSSHSHSPRYPIQAQPSNVSPVLQQGHFTAANALNAANPSPSAARLPYRQSPTLQSEPHFRQLPAPAPANPVTDDLIGAPFDGAAILNSIDSASYNSTPVPTPAPVAISIPAQQQKSSTAATVVSRAAAPLFRAVSTKKPPALRHSKSFAAMESSSTLVEKPGPSQIEALAAAPKRYSDESGGVPSKPANVRKKSGFSGFVNSLVGSQKKPMISAPENPIHVTHVGYDSTTGQFTVWP